MHPAIYLLHIGWLILSSLVAVGATPPQLSRPDKIPGNQIALRRCIGDFWTAWQKKDYQRASQYVIPEQRERFMSTRKFPVRKWEILAVKLQGTSQKAEVRVRVERYEPIMGGYFQWEQNAIWLKRAAIWQMQIPDARLGSP
jgi:hypothetical protein